ncbi:hypothetical protein Tco_0209049 [Tanacetum coccineum]
MRERTFQGALEAPVLDALLQCKVADAPTLEREEARTGWKWLRCERCSVQDNHLKWMRRSKYRLYYCFDIALTKWYQCAAKVGYLGPGSWSRGGIASCGFVGNELCVKWRLMSMGDVVESWYALTGTDLDERGCLGKCIRALYFGWERPSVCWVSRGVRRWRVCERSRSCVTGWRGSSRVAVLVYDRDRALGDDGAWCLE